MNDSDQVALSCRDCEPVGKFTVDPAVLKRGHRIPASYAVVKKSRVESTQAGFKNFEGLCQHCTTNIIPFKTSMLGNVKPVGSDAIRRNQSVSQGQNTSGAGQDGAGSARIEEQDTLAPPPPPSLCQCRLFSHFSLRKVLCSVADEDTL